MSEIALKFLFANLAAAGAILAVLVLRKPARTLFGAPLAYALWLLVPLAAFASLLPPRIVEIIAPAAPETPFVFAPPSISELPLALPASPPPAPTQTATATSQPLDMWALGLFAWLAGAIAMLVWQLRNQSRFMADARAGFAGPAVAGFLRPRIITPADFADRFDASERDVILAHERIHIARNDARINAAVALAQCLCWFNPLIHLAAHLMRIDQELACDAAVAHRHPKAKAVYAAALLKAQLAARPLPLGCYWPADSQHPLTERIEMLKRPSPTLHRRIAGASALALVAATAGLAAWASIPPVERITRLAPPASIAAIPQAASPEAPTPVFYEPQQQPTSQQPQAPVWSAPDPDADAPAGFDAADPIHVNGKVEKIDFTDTNYVVFIRASSISADRGWASKANNALWQLNPTPFWGDRAAVTASLMGKTVLAQGLRPIDKSCAATCRMYARDILMARQTALPALSSTPAFGVADFGVHYDTSRQTLFQGKVKRIEFGDRTFDVYVETKGWGGNPDWTYQVRSEYRHPRAEIERLLQGQTVSVAGWLGRLKLDEVYQSPTAVYGTDFQLANGRKLFPAGETLLSDVAEARTAATALKPAPVDPDKLPWIPPGFTQNVDVFDLNAPVVIDGTITRADDNGWWVEVIGFDPAATPGAKAGGVWRVLSDSEGKLADVGRRITARGYAATDKTCKPECMMTANGGYWMR